MTPPLFELPLRVSDAAALASVILEQLRRVDRPLTDEARNRVGGRVAGLKFEALRPWFGSIERDPVHPSAYYVCVDGVEGQPLLLRAAPASTPSSGLFPQAILIGRTYVAGSEAVLNAVPFGPSDSARILTYSEKVNTAFLPGKPAGRSLIRVQADDPGALFPWSFEGFRKILRATGQNLAAFALSPGQDPEAFYFATVWAAIRAGWREGYVLEPQSASPAGREVKLRAGMSREEVLDLF